MSDKIIRITSQQGFSDVWTNAQTPKKLNLCDFTIPSGLVVDMSKSYIAYNVEVGATDGATVINAGLQFKADVATTGQEYYNVPNSALIRNCSIMASNVGQIESLRRQDTLACGMWGLQHTAEEKRSDMNTFSSFNGGAGLDIGTSFNLDRVSNNITPDGTTVVSGLGGLALTSSNIARDVKVPLKDIFGIGVAEDWDTSKWGETRIHLEHNWDLVSVAEFGGAEDTTLSFDGTTYQGGITAPVGTLAPTGTLTQLITATAYGEWEYALPFFAGQTILVSATASDAAASVVDLPMVIKSIGYQLDNTAVPPTGDGNVYIETVAPWITNGTAAGITLTNVGIKAAQLNAPTAKQTTVNRAELVLYTRNDGTPTGDNYDYITYTSEQDNGNALQNFNRGYLVEAEAENIIVASCNNGSVLPNRKWVSYRYAQDNEEQTGNRDVVVGTPLHYDRLQRCLDRNADLPFRNAQLSFYKNGQAQDTSQPSHNIAVICETLEVRQQPKMVNLEIVSQDGGGVNGLQDIILYKMMNRTISI